MQKENCFELGYLSKAHGLDGKVQAFFDTENPERYATTDMVFLEIGSSLVPYFIEKCHPTGQGKFLLKFEEVESKEDAMNITGSKLFLPLTALPELEEGESYLHDTIGYQIIDKNSGNIGTVKEYVESGPQMIMISVLGEKEILIPVHDDIITATDHDTQTITTELPGGLLALYLEED